MLEVVLAGGPVPTPGFNEMLWFFTGLLVGVLAPTYYAAERMRGFSRALLNKMPYAPPPGKEEEEAMEDATEDS